MTLPKEPIKLTPEAVAYWYCRLNGFLQIENFVIHADPDCEPSENQNRAQVDLIGVRMPFRDEMDMKDDIHFIRQDKKTQIFLASAERALPQINLHLSNPILENIPRLLRAIGCVHKERIDGIAKQLYASRSYTDEELVIHWIAFGSETNDVLLAQKPEIVQIIWHDALIFIHNRFRSMIQSKSDNGNWPEVGRRLWELSERNVANFEKAVMAEFQTAGN